MNKVSGAAGRLGRAVSGFTVAVGLVLVSTASVVPLEPAPDAAAPVVARYKDRIPQLMAEQGLPGLAVALVDGDRTLWVEGFGYRDHQGGRSGHT
jgi:CubicO group peptidase (beta-lactamase class C family)